MRVSIREVNSVSMGTVLSGLNREVVREVNSVSIVGTVLSGLNRGGLFREVNSVSIVGTVLSGLNREVVSLGRSIV